jgi:hypothetical protein
MMREFGMKWLRLVSVLCALLWLSAGAIGCETTRWKSDAKYDTSYDFSAVSSFAFAPAREKVAASKSGKITEEAIRKELTSRGYRLPPNPNPPWREPTVRAPTTSISLMLGGPVVWARASSQRTRARAAIHRNAKRRINSYGLPRVWVLVGKARHSSTASGGHQRLMVTYNRGRALGLVAPYWSSYPPPCGMFPYRR